MQNLAGGYIDKETDSFMVGIYARLSREDDESDSVENQIKLLESIVSSNPNWTLVGVYSDDGFTGTTFDRPEFNRLMSDVDAKKVNLIILKDLSRLGRNLFESEKFFDYCLMNRIRIITVNDRIDSFSHDSHTSFVRPLTCLLNEKYASDVSYNVKSIFAGKRQRGEFIGAFAPYGYLKDSSNKNRLVIDPVVCDVVKRIYGMYLKGKSLRGIASDLNQEHVLSPAGYKALTTAYKGGKTINFLWNPETIKQILTNPTYAGCLSQGKTEKLSFKLKKSRSIPREKWIVVENTHTPIICKEDFEAVQILIGKNCYIRSVPHEHHLLSGLAYCGNCGDKLTFVRTGKFFYTMCTRYKKNRGCTRHTFSEDLLIEIILNELRSIASKTVDTDILNEIALNYINKKNQVSNQASAASRQKEILAIEKKLADIRRFLLAAYQDKTDHRISEEDFGDISNSLAQEKQRLMDRLAFLQAPFHQDSSEADPIQPITTSAVAFADFTTLDRMTLLKLVGKIEVFENKTVKIHYNFKNPF